MCFTLQQVMDNLKYSLKTQQFGKKRYHIFDKEPEKESMSLQVHDPHHNVSHLIEFNRSQQISGLSQTKKSNQLHNFVEQQSKTVKFTKPSGRTQSVYSLKQKNICHSIATTQKIKIPQNPQPQRQSRTRVQQETIRPQLQVLKHVLYNNEQRLQKLVDTVNSLYRNTIQLYNNHERKLKELVNSRCYQILSIFKSAIVEIKRKEDVMEQIDNRVSVLVNTLKDSKQTLRITKIKQECIQALQKQQLSILKTKFLQYEKFMTKSSHQVQKQSLIQKKWLNQSARRHQKSRIERKQPFIFDISMNSLENISSPKRKTTKQFQMATCSQVPSDMVSSLIDSPYVTLQLQQEDQKSPFQANQLFKISSTTPMTTNSNSQLNHSKQVQYSFRKITRQSEIVEMKNDDYLMPNRNARSFSYAPDNRHSLRLKEVLGSIPKAILSKEVWIDNLSCLRRKNGTYILDQSGNAIICSQQELQRIAAS